jgi:enhancing lycopene biosynthesis protein 2
MAKVAQERGEQVKLTIGCDGETAATLEKMGVEHVDTKVKDIVVDEAHRIVSTPAYMLGRRVSEVAEGIEKCVKAVMDMI